MRRYYAQEDTQKKALRYQQKRSEIESDPTKLEAFRAYNREVYRRTREKRLAYHARRPTEKIEARNITYAAILSGELVRPSTCSECSRPCKPDAHHDDYSKPLNVRWLCRACHGKAHRKHLVSP